MVKTLFLVDDDIDDRDIFKEAVHFYDPNIKLSFARDGLEAIDYLQTKKVNPDVIFLDYNMPRMNGLDCLKLLKAQQETKSIPIVMYSTSSAQRATVLKFGAYHYLEKAVSFEILCRQLDWVLSKISNGVEHQ